MLACESEFETGDCNNPGYSLCEYDIYGWVPRDKQESTGIGNHRLSVRKNLKTGEFELYRNYIGSESPFSGDIVIADKDMMVVLARATREWNEFHGWHGSKHEGFERCKHRYPKKALGCRVATG